MTPNDKTNHKSSCQWTRAGKYNLLISRTVSCLFGAKEKYSDMTLCDAHEATETEGSSVTECNGINKIHLKLCTMIEMSDLSFFVVLMISSKIESVTVLIFIHWLSGHSK